MKIVFTDVPTANVTKSMSNASLKDFPVASKGFTSIDRALKTLGIEGKSRNGFFNIEVDKKTWHTVVKSLRDAGFVECDQMETVPGPRTVVTDKVAVPNCWANNKIVVRYGNNNLWLSTMTKSYQEILVVKN